MQRPFGARNPTRFLDKSGLRFVRRVVNLAALPRLTSIACSTVAFWAAAAWCAPVSPEGPKLSGYTASSSGGVEGTLTIQYDDKGQVIGGNALPPPTQVYAQPSAVPSMAPNVGKVKSIDNPSVNTTADASKPGVKMVDPSVDFNSALKKTSKSSNLMEQRFDTKQAELNKDTPYSRDNVLTFDTWHGKYDTFGRKKAEVEVEDNFDRKEPRDKTMFEVKAIDRAEVSWSGQRAEINGLDERLTTEKNSRYDVTPQPASERLAPKSINQLSMQDINRYQFRRNRSDEPGLPYVKPGSDEVKTQGGAGQ